MRHLNVLVLVALAIAVLSGFTSCSSGSGSDNTDNVNSDPQQGGSGLTYSGPPAASSDVQSFKIHIWDNLAADNRCGSCHGQGGTGEGAFVRHDDINLAYSAAEDLIDLSNPGNSRMVTKVAADHNCWESDPGACAEIITGWITDWANDAGSAINLVTLTAPEFHPVQDSRSFPDNTNDFASTVYRVIRDDGDCADCHSENADDPQMPYFASADLDVAYAAAQSKIDLADADREPEETRSRFIVRLRDEGHNCWTVSCTDDARIMEEAIRSYAGGIPSTEVDDDLVTSGAVTLGGDGIVASTGGRVENDVVALYTFKPPTSGDVGEDISEVFDVSGEGTAANLRGFGSDVTWVGGWGARINDGRLQGSASKLYDTITLTGEYSIEAWVVPGNVEQDNSSRIVTYAGGGLTGNNFALAQSTYNYDFLHRSSTTDQDGMPAYSTPDDDEVLQATLQHVVMTYDPVNGRRIFVNGENVVAESDPQAGGNFDSWDSSFALALGQNAGGGEQWQGTIRLLAIHNRALSPDDIQTNFSVGVGEKYYLLFDLTRAGLVDMPEAYVAFEVEQFDSYGYLFKNPFFISLDSEETPASPIEISGMRIGLNGRELSDGQAYAKLNTIVDSSSYTPSGQTLSEFGTIIPVENGPEADQFFLTFDRIGNVHYDRPDPPAPSEITLNLESGEQARIAVRNFEEVNAALSQATGIPASNSTVRAIYNNVRQQLPQDEAIDGFLPAHQMGVTQLAVSYCGELASGDARESYFSDFDAANWGTDSPTVFGSSGSPNTGNRDAIIVPVLSSLAAHDHTTEGSLETQPDPDAVSVQLNALIDRLLDGTEEENPTASSTEEVVTSVCAAALGSAIMMIQ